MYAKLFARIIESSLMEEPIGTRYVFMALLAVADPEGYFIGTDVALARRLNIPLADFQAAIERLMARDPDSNSKEEEGRRIVRSDGERGYHLVNFKKYHSMRDQQARRDYMRAYISEYREQGKDKSRPVNTVNTVNSGKPRLAYEDEDEDEDEDKKRERASRFSRPTLEEVCFQAEKSGVPKDQAEAFFHFYESKGWKVGKSPMRNWRSAMTGWKIRWETERNSGAKHGDTRNNSRPPQTAVDRNAGTLNDPSDYADAR